MKKIIFYSLTIFIVLTLNSCSDEEINELGGNNKVYFFLSSDNDRSGVEVEVIGDRQVTGRISQGINPCGGGNFSYATFYTALSSMQYKVYELGTNDQIGSGSVSLSSDCTEVTLN